MKGRLFTSSVGWVPYVGFRNWVLTKLKSPTHGVELFLERTTGPVVGSGYAFTSMAGCYDSWNVPSLESVHAGDLVRFDRCPVEAA